MVITNSETLKSSKLKILFINIRSLRRKLDQILLLCTTMNLDVLILNETWLYSDEEPYFKMPGFHDVFNSRNDGVGGGCAIYVRNGIEFLLVEKYTSLNAILIEIQGFETKLRLLTFYKPPREDPHSILNFLESVLAKHENLICCCDANINLLDPTSKNTEDYVDLLTAYGCSIFNNVHQNSATRQSGESSTIIDHIFGNANVEVDLTISDCSLSDHKILFSEISFKPKKRDAVMKTFKKTNKSMFLDLVSHGVDLLLDEESLVSIEKLIYLIQTCKEASTVIQTRKVLTNSENWITLAILEKIKDREKYYKLVKRNPSGASRSGVPWKSLFESTSKQVKEMVQIAKKSHFESKFQEAGSNSRKLWKTINSEILGEKKLSSISTIVAEDGTVFDNPKDISNFLSISLKSAKEIPIFSHRELQTS